MSVSWRASRGGVGGRAGNDSRMLVEEADVTEDAMTAAEQHRRSREQNAGHEVRTKPCRKISGLEQCPCNTRSTEPPIRKSRQIRIIESAREVYNGGG